MIENSNSDSILNTKNSVLFAKLELEFKLELELELKNYLIKFKFIY